MKKLIMENDVRKALSMFQITNTDQSEKQPSEIEQTEEHIDLFKSMFGNKSVLGALKQNKDLTLSNLQLPGKSTLSTDFSKSMSEMKVSEYQEDQQESNELQGLEKENDEDVDNVILS